MRRVVPIALIALLAGCSSTKAAAPPPSPSATSNPLTAAACRQYVAAGPASPPSPGSWSLTAAACRQYVAALEWLDKTVAESQNGGYVPFALRVVARDGEKDVRQAAELADGETRQAMERTAAAIAVLGGTVEDFLAAPKGTMDVADEVATVGTSINTVRPLCAAAGSPVNILLQ
ncbi:hypothetical protein OIE13_05700 [Streptosporangium sp. NBC_01810]|uniref:hypothetical protein n=1 Tax=Streptosporangium sp. NBC_01810 TaxID=2975951 RepID=UPI002DD7DC85|nr:hypothetical protein [Streptosporangium sp. NBC_01810]WSA27367.1 hypothetical protein OIE13_05700 [Streptosporangium sp. NBC_01810]